MTTFGYTQQTDLTITTPAGADVLLLHALRGEEGLSRPFHFSVEMLSENANLDFSQIVGQGATVKVTSFQGNIRYFHGIVTRIAHAGTTSRFTSYIGELRPWFWMCSLTTDHKIFQNQSTMDIVKAVFSALGYSDYRDATTGTYSPREFCVQYGETAFDFVSRLLAEEGIHYFFEHADGKHTLVLADDSDAHKPIDGPTAIRFKAVTDSTGDYDDLVTACAFEQQVATQGFAINDYEFTTPSTDISSTATGTATGSLAIYEYPGGYTTKDRGDALSSLRIAAHETDITLLSGESSVRNFTPGFTFSLTDHDMSAANVSYLLRSVSHAATLETYSNTFEAMPASVPFRPRAIAAKPRIHGTQTAVVVGKSGEEIWTDQYGRVTVQFHWDRVGTNDEKSSCWIRVAQTWAGKSWGSLFTPRVGSEVVVSFLDGDPDRPIVIGTVYNATQALPYTLPADQTKSTIKTNSSKGGGGSNEIRFEDKAGSEELFVHAQKDWNDTVEHDRTTTIKNNDTLTVTQAKSVTVSQGDDSYTVSQGKRTIAVTAGDETHTVGGKRSLTVTGDETRTNSAKFTQSVTGDETRTNSAKFTHSITGDESLTNSAKFTHQVTGDYTLSITGNLTITAKSVSIKANTTLDNEAGTALTNKGASVTNQASGDLTNKGATQTVDGGGMLTIKGGMVKIN